MAFKQLIPSRLDRWTEDGRVRPEIAARIGTNLPFTLAEYETLRVNSWEQHLLFPLADDEVIIQIASQALDNCSRGDTPPSTYDEAMCNVIGPRMLQRLKELKAELAAAEARERVLREALEKYPEWVPDRDEFGETCYACGVWRVYETEIPVAELKGHNEGCARAALATPPGEAVVKLLADERERCARFVETYYADDYEHFGPMKLQVAEELRALPLDES
jgi:hypothetical protein